SCPRIPSRVRGKTRCGSSRSSGRTAATASVPPRRSARFATPTCGWRKLRAMLWARAPEIACTPFHSSEVDSPDALERLLSGSRRDADGLSLPVLACVAHQRREDTLDTRAIPQTRRTISFDGHRTSGTAELVVHLHDGGARHVGQVELFAVQLERRVSRQRTG